jgi:uncharacterized damage-inducible protein DinB
MATRYEAPLAGDETATLTGFLDHYRGVLLTLADGLPDDALRRALVPSGTTILGMIKHLAYVERGWFREVFAGEDLPYPFPDDDPDADLRIEPDEKTSDVLELYRDECERSRAIVASAASLDERAREPGREEYSLRWIVVHMIEETARHAGHADILREQLDGTTGVGYGYQTQPSY